MAHHGKRFAMKIAERFLCLFFVFEVFPSARFLCSEKASKKRFIHTFLNIYVEMPVIIRGHCNC